MMTRKQLLARIAKEKHLGTFKGFEHTKQLTIKAISGVEITPDILAKINKYTLELHTAEQLYVRKFLLAHNAVDRDRERFPENLLDDFAATIPAKSQLVGHTRGGPGKGLFFDAITEEMTPEQFKALTGEEPRLPENQKTVKVLWTWMYMLHYDLDETNKETILNINAGIYRHVSIGFRASDLIAVKGQYDQILYWEYVAPGEALEGSLVWLGAQPGATAQKKAGESDLSALSAEAEEAEEGDDIDEKIKGQHDQGGKKMKDLIKLLAMIFSGKSFTEDNPTVLFNEIKTAMEEKIKEAVEAAVKPLKEKILLLEPLEAKVKELQPLADEGKAFRQKLVEDYATLKTKIGDVDEKPETREKTIKLASGFGIDFLKDEVKTLQTRVEEKFPADPQLASGDLNAQRGPGEKKNPLIPEEK